MLPLFSKIASPSTFSTIGSKWRKSFLQKQGHGLISHEAYRWAENAYQIIRVITNMNIMISARFSVADKVIFCRNLGGDVFKRRTHDFRFSFVWYAV